MTWKTGRSQKCYGIPKCHYRADYFPWTETWNQPDHMCAAKSRPFCPDPAAGCLVSLNLQGTRSVIMWTWLGLGVSERNAARNWKHLSSSFSLRSQHPQLVKTDTTTNCSLHTHTHTFMLHMYTLVTVYWYSVIIRKKRKRKAQNIPIFFYFNLNFMFKIKLLHHRQKSGITKYS